MLGSSEALHIGLITAVAIFLRAIAIRGDAFGKQLTTDVTLPACNALRAALTELVVARIALRLLPAAPRVPSTVAPRLDAL